MCTAIFKKLKAPEVQVAPPAPTTQSNGDESGAQLAEKNRRRKRGFESTTASSLLSEATGKTTLGG